jgi:hypothetical protein
VTTKTPAAIGKANRDKGARAELAVVKWLRDNGWPGAERAIATGHRSRVRERADLGDITGTPGIAWQITDRGDLDQPAVFARRLAETEAQKQAAGAEFGFLVQRRRGASDAGRWWVHVAAVDMPGLLPKDRPRFDSTVRMTLADLVLLLRQAGYGSALFTITPNEEYL